MMCWCDGLSLVSKATTPSQSSASGPTPAPGRWSPPSIRSFRKEASPMWVSDPAVRAQVQKWKRCNYGQALLPRHVFTWEDRIKSKSAAELNDTFCSDQHWLFSSSRGSAFRERGQLLQLWLVSQHLRSSTRALWAAKFCPLIEIERVFDSGAL